MIMKLAIPQEFMKIRYASFALIKLNAVGMKMRMMRRNNEMLLINQDYIPSTCMFIVAIIILWIRGIDDDDFLY